MTKIERAIGDISKITRREIDDFDVQDEIEELLNIIQEEVNELYVRELECY